MQKDELRPLPKFIYIATGVVSFSNFSAFYSLALITAMLLYIPMTFPLTWLSTAALVTGTLVGGMLGALNCGWLADRFGRRKVMLSGSLVLLLSGLLVTFTPTLWLLIVGRSISGLGIGIITSLANLLIVEMSPAERRGAFATVPYFFHFAGTLMPLLIGLLLGLAVPDAHEDMTWRFMAATGVLISAVELGISIWWLPESPRWLLFHNRTEEGLAMLRLIYGPQNQARIIQDYQDMTASQYEHAAIAQNSLSWGDILHSAKYWRPIGTGIGLQVVRKLSGNAAISFYSTLILIESVGLNKPMALLFSLLIYAPDALIVLGVLKVLDSWGRKALLFMSCAGLVVTILPMAVALTVSQGSSSSSSSVIMQYLQGEDYSTASSLSVPTSVRIISVGSLILQRCSYSAGLGPIPSIHTAESLPYSVRARGLSLASFASWAAGAVSTLIFPALLLYAPASVPYWIFWSIAVVGLVFIWLAVRETAHCGIEQRKAPVLSKTESPPCARILHHPTPKAPIATAVMDNASVESFETINLSK